MVLLRIMKNMATRLQQGYWLSESLLLIQNELDEFVWFWQDEVNRSNEPLWGCKKFNGHFLLLHPPRKNIRRLNIIDELQKYGDWTQHQDAVYLAQASARIVAFAYWVRQVSWQECASDGKQAEWFDLQFRYDHWLTLAPNLLHDYRDNVLFCNRVLETRLKIKKYLEQMLAYLDGFSNEKLRLEKFLIYFPLND